MNARPLILAMDIADHADVIAMRDANPKEGGARPPFTVNRTRRLSGKSIVRTARRSVPANSLEVHFQSSW